MDHEQGGGTKSAPNTYAIRLVDVCTKLCQRLQATRVAVGGSNKSGRFALLWCGCRNTNPARVSVDHEQGGGTKHTYAIRLVDVCTKLCQRLDTLALSFCGSHVQGSLRKLRVGKMVARGSVEPKHKHCAVPRQLTSFRLNVFTSPRSASALMQAALLLKAAK